MAKSNIELIDSLSKKDMEKFAILSPKLRERCINGQERTNSTLTTDKNNRQTMLLESQFLFQGRTSKKRTDFSYRRKD